MTEHPIPIDITDVPDLVQLAEEVQRSHQPHILRKDGEDLAVVVPLRRRGEKGRTHRRKKTEADYEAFRQAAGGWKGLVDADKLIEDIYESRRISSRPPVKL